MLDWDILRISQNLFEACLPHLEMKSIAPHCLSTFAPPLARGDYPAGHQWTKAVNRLGDVCGVLYVRIIYDHRQTRWKCESTRISVLPKHQAYMRFLTETCSYFCFPLYLLLPLALERATFPNGSAVAITSGKKQRKKLHIPSSGNWRFLAVNRILDAFYILWRERH